ncbi:MAG: isopeptide-forming domain-containing fimbrial protein [Ruminococcus sp.]|nr:isopeptide-forming domain-containing fimbrial protein [Ruminococcus sp.]
MRKTKRFAAMIAALALAISMTVAGTTLTAFAATSTVSVSSEAATSTHTFKAYPIFLGDVDANGKIAAPSTEGTAFTNSQLAGLLGVDSTEVPDLAAALEAMQSNSTEAKNFAAGLGALLEQNNAGTDITAAGAELAPGYYLIVEENTVPENNVLNAQILKVVGGESLTIAPKTSAPTLVKKVGEEKAVVDEDYGSSGDYVFNDVADHSITEEVPFKIIATLPANIAEYKAYMYKITDTYDDGLTIDDTSIEVMIDGTPVYQAGAAGSSLNATEHGLTVTVDETNRKIVVNFVDITAYGVAADSVVTVTYNGCLNSSAAVATAYELNGAKLTYSRDYNNDANWTGFGEKDEETSPENPGTPGTPKEDEDNPDNPNGQEEKNNGGDTPEDKVILYTYQLIIQKTNGQSPITGEAAQAATFFVRNSAGQYIEVDENGKVTGFSDDETPIALDAAGQLNIIGLDDDVYTITELTPPTGYKLPADPVSTVTITGGIVTTQEWADFTAVESTYDVEEQEIAVTGSNIGSANAEEAGTYTADISNAPLGTLPETGGIGTTLFYVLGGATAAAAGTILIVRRRAKKDQ